MSTAIRNPQPTTLDSIKKSLVALRMPRALEVLDQAVRRIEQGEIDAIGALDQILMEELSIRENRRIRMALLVARLTAIKTIVGFDFAFQPSLDKNRILALAELTFIDRGEVVHLLGPPGTGKSHLATALAVEAVKAGKSVAFSTLADLVTSLAKAEKEGTLRERIRYLARPQLLVVDEIGYLPVVPGGGNLFFQLVNARYEKGAMILTSNRGFAEWGEIRYEATAARWRVKVVETSEFAGDAPNDKFGICDDREYRSQHLVDFQRRFGMGTLSVASTVTVEKIDEVARTNPHLAELTAIYRLHAAASLRMQRPIRYPHVLLLGAPGVGKTHVCRALAHAMGMPFSVIDAPAISGGAAFAGRDKSWKHPSPGKISEALISHEMASQMVLIDELDKTYQHGGESDTLAPLHVLLEPSSARHWRDECLAVHMDASWISVVATANSIDDIGPSLLDRFTVIEIERPDRTQLRKVIVSIASSLASDHGDFFTSSPIADEVIEILSAGENTPRSIRQCLSMAFVHAASIGRRQVIPADLVAVSAMTFRMDQSQGRIGFIR